MAVATYFWSNISATMSQGMGPSPISKKKTKSITCKGGREGGREGRKEVRNECSTQREQDRFRAI